MAIAFQLPNRVDRSDGIYIKVTSRWMYLYRIIDGNGDTVKFRFGERRDPAATKQFLREAPGAMS